jgi:hypothetical protein
MLVPLFEKNLCMLFFLFSILGQKISKGLENRSPRIINERFIDIFLDLLRRLNTLYSRANNLKQCNL